MPAHKMLLINTGGTIAGNVADDKKDENKIREANSFAELILPTRAHFSNVWGVDLEIEPFDVCNIDSSDVLPSTWRQLISTVVENYDNYDSFVITHGTNTLGYTCSALSFALTNPAKPIILTGSQVPSGMPGSDALMNLTNAIRVAAWPYEETQIKGVAAVFGSHIITGTRAKKTTEFDYDSFTSFSRGSIGRIGRIINIDAANLQRHLSYLEQPGRFFKALRQEDLIWDDEFDMRIASLTEFPGMPGDIFKTLMEHNDIQGFIFRAFGAGDVSHNLHDALADLKQKQIPIVVTTQAPNGNSNFQVNEPGQHLKEKGLAIPAYDMSIESQTTKLAWLLAKKSKGDMDYRELINQMTTDLRGEIDVLLERRQ